MDEPHTPKKFKYQKDARLSWYRSKIDKDVMRQLMKTSDWQGLKQCGLQWGLFFTTGTLAYLAYLNVDMTNWFWSVPLVLLALFVHGTFMPFMGYVSVHELSHKTPFKTKSLNEFFLYAYGFLTWADPVWFRPSHVKHHQVTVHTNLDGEVELPMKLNFDKAFWRNALFFNPDLLKYNLNVFLQFARGELHGEWHQFVMPEEDKRLRRLHRNYARFVLIGHLCLFTFFLLSGLWFLVFLVTLPHAYCNWLGVLCGTPQHYGMRPNVSDFRLCCRTYTCSRFVGFLYWNMQYHIEHHMFPAVPFFNLPKLRKAIEHDLPPAPHGLLATWKHILDIHRKSIANPDYIFTPVLPTNSKESTTLVDDHVLESEASALSVT